MLKSKPARVQVKASPSPAATSPKPTHPDGGTNVFALRPIELEGFRLSRYEATAIGRPDLAQWQTAFRLACSAEESSPFWVGDLLAYADSRAEWRDKLDQAMSATGLAKHTLENHAVVSRRVIVRARELAPSYSHAEAVSQLDHPEQIRLLTEAKARGWTRRELRRAVAAVGRETVLEGQAPGVHTVDVTVRLVIEAASAWEAKDLAWALVKGTLKDLPHAHVIGANALEPTT